MKNILDANAKKATLFHIRTAKDIDWSQLNAMAYNPEQALDVNNKRIGFVHPLETLEIAPEGEIFEQYEGGLIGALRTDKSVVTSTAIKQAAAVQIKQRLEELPEDARLSKEERESITIAVRQKLLKDSTEVSSYVPFIIDEKNSRLIIFSTTSDILEAVKVRLNNMFAGDLELIDYSSFAVKAEINNIAAKFLSKLQTYHTAHAADAHDMVFEGCDGLSFGTGVKLSSFDDTSGNDGGFPSIDVTDERLLQLIESATGIEKIGLFLVHSTSDIDFTLNSKLQFDKLGLDSVLIHGLQEDDLQDPTGEIRATAQILADCVDIMQKNVTNWLGMSEHIG
ncbi:MAG: recombination-associated protein RdgC [Aestuariibacter sp.]|nr:recombination-associated protein RdgC [Aestuariibacter sp.]|tara:strand:- start:18403 stop:19416 length:1014 start_codon:yes stop_codon:yes gene_type:complete